MKSKKFLIGVATCALAVPMFTSSVFAAWDGAPEAAGDTTVSYDNSNTIPDPDHPGNPQWAVKVPSTIKFTDANKRVDASVSIEKVNGGSLPDYTLHVGVKSANKFKLEMSGSNKDPLDYDLLYEKNGSLVSVKADTTDTVELGTFGANLTEAKTITGVATLDTTQSATEIGSHLDTLTYYISKNVF